MCMLLKWIVSTGLCLSARTGSETSSFSTLHTFSMYVVMKDTDWILKDLPESESDG